MLILKGNAHTNRSIILLLVSLIAILAVIGNNPIRQASSVVAPDGTFVNVVDLQSQQIQVFSQSANCVVPISGDWFITQSCTLSSNDVAPGNVIIQSGAVLTIPNGVSLHIDFGAKHLLVRSGGGVLIKPGGKIFDVDKKLIIAAKDQNGTAIPGLFTTIQNGPGNTLTGFTPAGFRIKPNAQYQITPGEYPPYTFDHWEDTLAPSTATQPRFISINTDTQITGVYVNTLVTLNSTRGPAGHTINVTGNAMPVNHAYAFANNSAIVIKYGGIPVTTKPASVLTDGSGAFKASFVVTNYGNGPHGIEITDASANTWKGQFIQDPTVPTISLSPSSAANGNTTKITGTHFAPHSRIVISYDGVPALSYLDATTPPTPLETETDNNGAFTTIFQIQYSARGAHIISASDGSNIAKKTLTVTPYSLLLNPLTGHNGTTVNFHITGFAANSPVSVTFNGGSRIITTDAPQGVVTGSEGDLPGSFSVPSVGVGTYPIVFSDGGGNTFTRSFVVTSLTSKVFNTKNLLTGLPTGPKGTDGPDAFAFIPDNGPGVNGTGNFMIAFKNGTIVVYKNTGGSNLVPVKQALKFVDVPAVQGCAEDAGVLGIAFDPLYSTTHKVYVYSTVLTSGSGCDPLNQPGVENRVLRYTAMTDGLGNIVATSSTPELILGGILAGTDLNGGHLAFDNQGNLVISTGETYRYIPSQDLTSLGGKILKIKPLATPDASGKLYSIPPTNPYAFGVDSTTRKEIFSSGIRNPFSFDIDSVTGKLYVSDVGSHTWETVLDSTTSHNFGWSYYEGPTANNPQSITSFSDPIYWYPHNGIEPITSYAQGPF